MFDVGVPHPLFDVIGLSLQSSSLGPGVATSAYIPSADGQRFLATIRPNAQVSIPVIVTLNWTAGLKN